MFKYIHWIYTLTNSMMASCIKHMFDKYHQVSIFGFPHILGVHYHPQVGPSADCGDHSKKESLGIGTVETQMETIHLYVAY